MNTPIRSTLLTLMIAAGFTLAGCAPDTPHDDGHAAPANAAEFERGPNRGRMLRDGDFALEVTIFETGVPPQFRLYAYRDDRPIPAQNVSARIVLSRLGGTRDVFEFRPGGEALVSDATVFEPHSFDVVVTAEAAGKQHRWEYASYEGRTSILPEVARSSGVVIEQAGPATIRSTVTVLGTVAFDEARMARVRARFPGIVREVRASPGDAVRRGQILALVEGNESMRTYPVTAPISGYVMLRNTNIGDVTGDTALFELADLSSVWVDLNVFGRDIGMLKAGQTVKLTSTVGDQTAMAKIDRILPIAMAGSQSAVARVRLANPDGQWRPGLAVSAEVTVATHEVPLAVRTLALQPFRDFTVVYANYGDTYEVRMLELGRQDPDFTEVLGGLAPGTPYVTEQAFLIRADVEKSGASHDH